jgi:hypothetical protein
MLAMQVRRFLIFNGDIVVRIVPVPTVANIFSVFSKPINSSSGTFSAFARGADGLQ